MSHAPAVFAHSYILLRGSTNVFDRYDKDMTLKGRIQLQSDQKRKKRTIPQGKIFFGQVGQVGHVGPGGPCSPDCQDGQGL